METREGVLVKRITYPEDTTRGKLRDPTTPTPGGRGRAPSPSPLVHRRDLAPGGRRRSLLYGDGAYRSSTNPTFKYPALPAWTGDSSSPSLSRVRGGQELGRARYEEGRMAQKPEQLPRTSSGWRGSWWRRGSPPPIASTLGGSAGGAPRGGRHEPAARPSSTGWWRRSPSGCGEPPRWTKTNSPHHGGCTNDGGNPSTQELSQASAGSTPPTTT